MIALLFMLQVNLQLLSQPRLVDLALGEGLKQQIGGSGQGASAHHPVEHRAGRAARDEGQILVADVVVIHELLEVSHCSPQWSGLSYGSGVGSSGQSQRISRVMGIPKIRASTSI